ncbi:MAG: hypothetical protein ACLQVN_20785 [Bryobacteraceae bacterium]
MWLAVLIAGSLQPARPDRFHYLHREIHWLAFAGASLLLFVLARTRQREVLRAFAILSLACFLELLQHLIYGNSLEWRDIRDDALAILLTFALYRLTGSWKPRPASRPQ